MRAASPKLIMPLGMAGAAEIEMVAKGVWLWRVYDRSVKADLFSTALLTSSGTFLIDPVPLTQSATSELTKLGPVTGIIVSNENHQRAAGAFAREFDVPIHERALKTDSLVGIAIDGAPAGEMAVLSESDAGTIVIGDALINFEPYGFSLLPAKYCSNQKTMRLSLKKLLDYPFERMLFAHGLPILSGARSRLEQLLRDP